MTLNGIESAINADTLQRFFLFNLLIPVHDSSVIKAHTFLLFA